MATKQATVGYILDQLADVRHISARKMFGEYAVYCGDQVVALVCDDQLFVKMTDEGKAFVGDRYVEGEAYPGAKPSMLIDGDLIEDRDWLGEVVQITAAHLPPSRPKKRNPKKARRVKA